MTNVGLSPDGASLWTFELLLWPPSPMGPITRGTVRCVYCAFYGDTRKEANVSNVRQRRHHCETKAPPYG